MIDMISRIEMAMIKVVTWILGYPFIRVRFTGQLKLLSSQVSLTIPVHVKRMDSMKMHGMGKVVGVRKVNPDEISLVHPKNGAGNRGLFTRQGIGPNGHLFLGVF